MAYVATFVAGAVVGVIGFVITILIKANIE